MAHKRTPCRCGHVHKEGVYQTGSYGGRATVQWPCHECDCGHYTHPGAATPPVPTKGVTVGTEGVSGA